MSETKHRIKMWWKQMDEKPGIPAHLLIKKEEWDELDAAIRADALAEARQRVEGVRRAVTIPECESSDHDFNVGVDRALDAGLAALSGADKPHTED